MSPAATRAIEEDMRQRPWRYNLGQAPSPPPAEKHTWAWPLLVLCDGTVIEPEQER